MEQPEAKSDTVQSNQGDCDELLKNVVEAEKQLQKIMAPSAFVHGLPKEVQRRIKALKRLQCDSFLIETKFYEELHQLEAKYEKMHAPLFQKRSNIVSAAVEPTDSECDWQSDSEEETLPQEIEKKIDLNVDDNKAEDAVAKGVPDFWLQIFKNVDIMSAMIQEHDEPILKHLIDVTAKTATSDPQGFTLEFHFEPNEYFTNTVLTKEYNLKFDVDSTDPLEYEGPEISKCSGCVIDWKPDMNVTVKQVKKRQQHKKLDIKRTVIEDVRGNSFFTFFSPPEVPEGTEPNEETAEVLSNDYEVGQLLREHIIPKAVLYFTGDALEYSDESDDDSEEETSADNSAEEK